MRWTAQFIVASMFLGNVQVLHAQDTQLTQKIVISNQTRFWRSDTALASVPKSSVMGNQLALPLGRPSYPALFRTSQGSGLPSTNMIPNFIFRGSQQTSPIPTGVATADFNGDGKVDWIVASGDGTLWLYLGNGDGTSQPPLAIWPGGKLLGHVQGLNGQPAQPPVPVALAAGSLRNNGVEDLLIAEGNDNDTLAVMLGNGDGTFQPAVRYPLASTGSYIRTADVNGDGNPDVIVGILGGGIAVYLGDGAGKLSGQGFVGGLPSGPPAPDPDNSIPDLPTVFAVGDYDQDGILDIAYAGGGGGWILRGIGNGQFVAVQALLFQRVIPAIISGVIYATSASFIDVDGDGLLDVVVTDNFGEAFVYRNLGDGTFSAEPISSFALGGVPGDIAVADVNGDGHPDIVTGSLFFPLNSEGNLLFGQTAANILSVAYGDGRGGFSGVRTFSGGTSIVSLTVGDMNRDGFPDVLTADQLSGSYTLFTNDGKGGFGSPQGAVTLNPVPNANGRDQAFSVEDIDGDGQPDVITIGAGNAPTGNPPTLSVSKNLGDGQFSSPIQSNLPLSSSPSGIDLADFRNTGLPDAVIADPNNSEVYFVQNIGGGQFGPAVAVGGWRAVSIRSADLNHDGRLDLITADEGSITVALGNGSGGFTVSGKYSFAYTGNGIPQMIASDLNNDGKLDVLLWSGSGGGLFEFFGNGDGTFQPATQVLSSLQSGATADLNNDGFLDFLAVPTSPSTPQLQVYAGSATGTFSLASTYATYGGASVRNVLLGNIDGDGTVDAAIEEYTSDGFGFVQVFQGNGDLSLTPTFRIYATYTLPVISLADVDGDGRADLIEWDDFSHAFHVASGSSVASGVEMGLLDSGPITTSAEIGVELDTSNAETVTLGATPASVSVPASLSFVAGSPYQQFAASVDPSLNPANVFEVTGQTESETASIFIGKAFNPIPRLATLDLQNIVAGSSGFSLTLAGADFVPGAAVLFDGVPQPTQYLSPTQVEFNVTSQQLESAGSHELSVSNPAPGGGESASQNFFVEADTLAIGGITPSTVLAGGSSFTLNVNGSIFTTSSVVLWDGADRPTTFIDRNNVSISVGSADIATPETHTISVFDPRNGGLTSNTVTFSAVSDTAPMGQVEAFGNSFNGSSMLGTTAAFSLSGWAVSNIDAPIKVFLRFSGSNQNFAAAPVNINRHDIAAKFGRPDWLVSGYDFFDFVGNTPGTYTFQVFAQDQYGLSTELLNPNGPITVTVVNEPKPFGSLDTLSGPSGTLDVPQNGNLYVSGWAAINNTWQQPAGVRVYLDSVLNPVGNAELGIVRPDVVASTGNSNLLHSGFALQFNVGNIPLGVHTIIVQAFNSIGDGTQIGFVQGGGLLVNVTAPDATVPTLSLSSSTATFGNQPVGTASSAQTISVTNMSSTQLRVLGVTVSGDFNQTTNCLTIASGESCSMNVAFLPVNPGTRTGELNIYSNATVSPAMVSLAGTGVGPSISISANSLSFPAEVVGSSGAPQTLSLTNNGNTAAQVLGLSVPPGFSQSSTCGTSLKAGSSCTISVTFAPISGGTINGTLEIMTDASPPTVEVSLSGTGQDFSLASASGSSATATVMAGQTAVYHLVLSSAGGLTGTASLVCTGAPANAVCSVNPSSGSLSNTVDLTVSVTTAGSAGVALRRPPGGYLFAILASFFAVLLGIATVRAVRFEPLRPRFGLAIVVIWVCLVICACGGGSNSGGPSTSQGPPNPSVTPAGNYTLTITATYSNINRTTALTLNVD